MTDSSDLIKPGEIPGKDINVELITLSAQNLRTAATRVRDHGAAAVTNWSALSGSYSAPDAEQLFGVMVPVGTSTTTFGDHLDTATGALETFAEEIAPIKAELDRLRAEAWAFTGEVSGGVDVPVVYATRGGVVDTGKTQQKEWHEVDESIDKNNQLRIDVNTQVELMWAAERKAANTIRALYCAVPLTADDGSGGANTYMYDEIPDNAEVPWGHPVERTEGCGEAAVTFVFEDFLWKGIVVGGIWGTIEGLGGLISYNSQTGQWGDWEFAGQAWKQLGQLAYAITVPTAVQQAAATQDNAFGEWNRESQETVVNTLKGIVAWDQWAENPGAAAGTTVFNVGTIFIPAGAAVTSIKSGALASKLATAARVMDYLDASSLALKAGTGAFRFTSTGLSQLSNVLDGLKVADSADSQIPSINGNTISVGDNVVSGADEFTPPVREDVSVDAPVREPAEVGSTTGSGGSGSGGGGLTGGHGGGGHGGSGLPDGPTGSPDAPGAGGRGDDAADGPRNDSTTEPNPAVQEPNPAVQEWVDTRVAEAENAGLGVQHVESGVKGDWNPTLNHLEPNTTYIVNDRFTYTTNESGVVVEATARLDEVYSGADIDQFRNEYNQKIAGGEERIVGVDHGGHIWGAQFGSPGERVNLFAQLGSDNVGRYLTMEQRWAEAIRNGSTVDSKVAFEVAPGSTRPTSYIVQYSIDGGVVRTQRFNNSWSPE